MRYAKIDKFEVCNGEGVGMSLFVQGCNFHCPGCFNSDIWDFTGGYEWDNKAIDDFLNLASRQYIDRISILGGEPLASQNLDDVYKLVVEIRKKLPEKCIWLYSGYTWEECNMILKGIDEECTKYNAENKKRIEIISLCDTFVDGRYIDSKKDLTLKFRGSSNQRIINVTNSLKMKTIMCQE